ncbi:hypothetical protein B0F90DRAFT_1314681 [Multifurca ochricompacta]|uniref:Uncharacterized protein n=1 Tax=Multifurca ochricompacta TaxID=376703 RepID=A0AAD4QQ08_9AGAM|nr:hypothetical protein B0F90DRAFT_1314681 [Multifurca ochricompacta]
MKFVRSCEVGPVSCQDQSSQRRLLSSSTLEEKKKQMVLLLSESSFVAVTLSLIYSYSPGGAHVATDGTACCFTLRFKVLSTCIPCALYSTDVSAGRLQLSESTDDPPLTRSFVRELRRGNCADFLHGIFSLRSIMAKQSRIGPHVKHNEAMSPLNTMGT